MVHRMIPARMEGEVNTETQLERSQTCSWSALSVAPLLRHSWAVTLQSTQTSTRAKTFMSAAFLSKAAIFRLCCSSLRLGGYTDGLNVLLGFPQRLIILVRISRCSIHESNIMLNAKGLKEHLSTDSFFFLWTNVWKRL